MPVAYYPAIIERSSDGYGVFFPDVPGCTSFGDTLQDAALNAEEALSGHFDVAAEFGDAIPEPSELDAVVVDDGVDEATRLLVRAELPGRTTRINITIDDSILGRIDRITTNRSGFFADAARAHLAARR